MIGLTFVYNFRYMLRLLWQIIVDSEPTKLNTLSETLDPIHDESYKGQIHIDT